MALISADEHRPTLGSHADTLYSNAGSVTSNSTISMEHDDIDRHGSLRVVDSDKQATTASQAAVQTDGAVDTGSAAQPHDDAALRDAASTDSTAVVCEYCGQMEGRNIRAEMASQPLTVVGYESSECTESAPQLAVMNERISAMQDEMAHTLEQRDVARSDAMAALSSVSSLQHEVATLRKALSDEVPLSPQWVRQNSLGNLDDLVNSAEVKANRLRADLSLKETERLRSSLSQLVRTSSIDEEARSIAEAESTRLRQHVAALEDELAEARATSCFDGATGNEGNDAWRLQSTVVVLKAELADARERTARLTAELDSARAAAEIAWKAVDVAKAKTAAEVASGTVEAAEVVQAGGWGGSGMISHSGSLFDDQNVTNYHCSQNVTAVDTSCRITQRPIIEFQPSPIAPPSNPNKPQNVSMHSTPTSLPTIISLPCTHDCVDPVMALTDGPVLSHCTSLSDKLDDGEDDDSFVSAEEFFDAEGFLNEELVEF